MLAAFFSLIVTAAPVAGQIPGTASDDVPLQIAARARSVAEASSRLRSMLAQPRTLFIGVELVRRKGDDNRELAPLYRVLHYRYSDDTTIMSLVDVARGRVTEESEARHAPVALAAAELAEARTLALANPRVARALERYRERLLVEPLVVRTSDPSDPWFGRRVVRLLFRVGQDYVSDPVVFVDLTGREVIVQPAHGERP
ncbi:MAG: hypothetical protein ABWX67_13875 [Allosphingosinicella sp.]